MSEMSWCLLYCQWWVADISFFCVYEQKSGICGFCNVKAKEFPIQAFIHGQSWGEVFLWTPTTYTLKKKSNKHTSWQNLMLFEATGHWRQPVTYLWYNLTRVAGAWLVVSHAFGTSGPFICYYLPVLWPLWGGAPLAPCALHRPWPSKWW